MPGRVGAARAGGARAPEPVPWAHRRVAPRGPGRVVGWRAAPVGPGLGVWGASELSDRVGEGERSESAAVRAPLATLGLVERRLRGCELLPHEGQ